ncbi:MAG: CBS domain-containing protein [Flavobacteriales bacterium]|nr:CBS domain-containing protein [Flavobacteriales bacterium]
MVKSFTGVRRAPKKEIQQIVAEDYMTSKLVTFRPDQNIGEVFEMLINKNISGGPVIDESGKLVGVISEGDCLKEIVRGKYNNSPNKAGVVSDHMVSDVHTISPNMPILEVAHQFLELKVRRFPVMREGKLVGQISQRDVMRAVRELKHQTW